MKEKNMKFTIKTIYNDLSKKEKLIADYILKNINKSTNLTIADLAENIGVVNSTIFSFTKKLGFKGFREFRDSLLKDQFNSNINVHEKISKNDSITSIIEKVFNSNIKSLEDTKKIAEKKSFSTALKILTQVDIVHFFGVGGSSVIAHDAYHKFLRSPLKCRFDSDFHLQLMQASLLTKNDCAFIISHSGMTKESIEIADIAKERKAKIIVLTSYPLSILAKKADITFISTAEEIEYRSEALSSRIAQLSILDTIFILVMLNNPTKTQISLNKIRTTIAKTKRKGE